MSPRNALAAVALAGCAAAAFAEPIPPPRPVGGGEPQPACTPKIPPPAAGAKPPAEEEPFTAFPYLVPLPPAGKGEELKPRGGRQPWPHKGPGLFEQLTAADTPLLRKVQITQVGEGQMYLARVRIRMEIGQFQPSDFIQYLEMRTVVHRLAGDLLATPEEKVAWHEDTVWAFRQDEWFTEARVRVGVEPPQTLNLVRFHRLGAEADLVRAMEVPRGNR